jgi:hypothetical protein
VVGRELPEARRLLAEAGAGEVVVTETAPPGRPAPTGPCRVVRQRSTAGGVSLVVAASAPLPGEKHGNDGA